MFIGMYSRKVGLEICKEIWNCDSVVEIGYEFISYIVFHQSK